MGGDFLRQVIYAAVLIMMVATLWLTEQASQLEVRVRRGYLEPLPPVHVQQP
jgi:hypothetical protein